MNGGIPSVNGGTDHIKKAEAGRLGFLSTWKALKVESQLGEHSQAIIAHLYCIERPAGFAVAP
jgi:hypothetical protein